MHSVTNVKSMHDWSVVVTTPATVTGQAGHAYIPPQGDPRSAAVRREEARPLQGSPFQAPVESEGLNPVRGLYTSLSLASERQKGRFRSWHRGKPPLYRTGTVNTSLKGRAPVESNETRWMVWGTTWRQNGVCDGKRGAEGGVNAARRLTGRSGGTSNQGDPKVSSRATSENFALPAGCCLPAAKPRPVSAPGVPR